jgi:hypothetical protein
LEEQQAQVMAQQTQMTAMLQQVMAQQAHYEQRQMVSYL